MKRPFVAGMLALALAGCAQSRSVIPKGASGATDPVALTPVPSVYDTINRGTGSPALTKTALGDPADPHWGGRAQMPVASRPATAEASDPSQGPTQPPASNPVAGPPGLVAGGVPGSAGPQDSALPMPTSTSLPPMAASGPIPDLRSPVEAAPLQTQSALPFTLARPGDPMPESLSRAVTSQESGTTSQGAAVPSTSALGPAAELPALNPASSPTADSRTAVSSGAPISPGNPPAPLPSLSSRPADPAVRPSASQVPPGQGAQTPAPKRLSDPLLGPNPELMPPLPPLPELNPAASPSAPAAGPESGEPLPAKGASSPAEPVTQPGSVPLVPPGGAGPPTGDDPSTDAGGPADATKVAEMPLPELAPAATSPLPTIAARSSGLTSSSTATSRSTTRHDTQVVRTSMQKPVSDASSASERHDWKEAGRSAARVGDEIITMHELKVATKEQYNRFKPQQPRSDFAVEDQAEKHKEILMLAKQTLDGLIDRSLLVQEAKRALKNSKQVDKIMEMADKVWREEQLPPLEYQYHVDTEQQLRDKLAEEGRSLDAMRLAFRQDYLAFGFLHEKLRDRVKVELPDLLRYYNEHVHDRELDRPAQITWRELVVEVDKYPSRDEARRKANALLEKLRRGADFAQLARTESDGPTSSRNQGGMMQTSPGGYAVTAVNAALQSLPIGQVSGVLEGSSSYHIVRVEKRRPAGPASFEELQDKIRSLLSDQRFQAERTAYIAKLRQRTLVSNIFDGTELDPTRAIP